MKILVVSDTHGDALSLRRAVEKIYDAEVVIHCGDGAAEFESLRPHFPDKAFIGVRGNNDFCTTAQGVETITLEDRKIFITHGHLQNCKYGLMNLCYAAKEQSAQLLCFGHTHTPLECKDDEIFILNPGSCRGYNATFAVVDLNEKGIVTRIMRLNGC